LAEGSQFKVYHRRILRTNVDKDACRAIMKRYPVRMEVLAGAA
jgi:hypothetical protein